MGQKINPISLRLQTTNRYFDSCWYSKFFYSDLFDQDLKVQNYLQSIFKQLKFPTSRIFLQSSQKKIQISSFFCHPLKGRRVRSYYFRRKYEKLAATSFASLASSGNAAKQATQVVGFASGARQSMQSKQIGSNSFLVSKTNQSNKQRTEITKRDAVIKESQEKKIDLKNILYQRYLPSFYLSTALPSEAKALSTTQNWNKRVLYSQERWMSHIKCVEKLSSCNHTFNKEWFLDFIKKKSKKKEEQKETEANSNLFLQSKIIKKKVEKDLFGLRKISGKSEKLKKKRKYSISFPEKGRTFQYSALNPFVSHFLDTPFFFNNKQKDREVTPLALLAEQSRTSEAAKKEQSTTSWISADLYTQTPFYTDLIFNSVEKGFESVSTQKNQKLGIYKNRGNISYQKHMETVLSLHLSTTVEINTVKTYDHFRSASFLAEEIVYYLEQRIPFRRIKNKILKEVEHLTSIKGIRITCSGRVGGRSKKAQRSKIDLVKFGETSLHVFSSRIDFASKTALTSFGLMGIKVWISYTN